MILVFPRTPAAARNTSRTAATAVLYYDMEGQREFKNGAEAWEHHAKWFISTLKIQDDGFSDRCDRTVFFIFFWESVMVANHPNLCYVLLFY